MNDYRLKIFFDGACPFCVREMRFLMRMNRNGHLAFEDTSKPGFDPTVYGISQDAHRVIHALTFEGQIVTGVEVFRRAYGFIGFGWLLAPTGWPILKPIFDRLYLLFARNRIRIGKFFGRKCDTSCEI